MRTSFVVTLAAIASLFGFSACEKKQPGTGAATATVQPDQLEIQTKAIALKLGDEQSFDMVGVMAAYEPKSRSFWWRPQPMIADGSMLESYYQAHCKFFMDGSRVGGACLRGPDMVMFTTDVYADSLDAGLEKVEHDLKENPNLVGEYKGPHDNLVNFKSWGQDFTTPQGTPPASIRSVKYTGSGYVVEIACSCGDAVIQLNRDRFMYDLKKK